MPAEILRSVQVLELVSHALIRLCEQWTIIWINLENKYDQDLLYFVNFTIFHFFWIFLCFISTSVISRMINTVRLSGISQNYREEVWGTKKALAVIFYGYGRSLKSKLICWRRKILIVEKHCQKRIFIFDEFCDINIFM